MDIEGSEYVVIDDILTHDVRPRQLLTEFHHGMYGIARRENSYRAKASQYYGLPNFFNFSKRTRIFVYFGIGLKSAKP